ncbi:MAG: DNA repair exonuclease [Blastocatellia bacterium]|nr:DNA repair exonuclease [Blastocatellia bacterium]
MRGIRFLHAADLHIDSPFRGLAAAPEHVVAAARSSTLEAFDGLVSLALERGVDFVVLAGDVYDAADRSLRAQLRFRDGLDRMAGAGIEVFVAHGNHDPLDSRMAALTLPERVVVFGPEVETHEVVRDGVAIAAVSGIGYRTRVVTENLSHGFSAMRAPFHVGVLHCNLGGNTGHENYAPCTLSDLIGTGVDYWALGHVHTRAVLNATPHVVYPGNSQGRHINEPGPRGCYVVTVSEHGDVALDFEALDRIRWHQVDVPINDVDTVDALEVRLLGALAELSADADGRSLICRVRLSGRGSLHADLSRRGASDPLLERLREALAGADPFVWIEDLAIATRPDVDFEARRMGDDLVAEILEAPGRSPATRGASWSRPTSRWEGCLRTASCAKAIGTPSDAELREAVEEAALVLFDGIEGAS